MPSSLCGQFLIARKQLRDSNFYRTVVLIVEHGSDGAMGLVLNRPSSVTVSHALSGHFDLPDVGDLVFVGGPVEPSALFIMHNAPELEEGERSVVSGLYVGSSPAVFERVMRMIAEEESPHLKFRVFSGCAGWGPGQLEGELDRGDWYLHPASLELIFHEDPYELWETVLQQMYESKRILPHPSTNPEWN